MNLISRVLTLALVLALLLAPTLVAHAQALPTATGPGSYVSLGFGTSAYQADYGKRILGGAVLFSDLHVTSGYGLEAEVRMLRYHTDENVTQSTYLVGPQAYLYRIGPLKPYVKLMVGVGHMQFPYGYAQGSYLVVAGGGGVEMKISSRVSLRLLDVEYQSWPQFTYGSLHPYGASFGLNFRLTSEADKPRGQYRRYPEY